MQKKGTTDGDAATGCEMEVTDSCGDGCVTDEDGWTVVKRKH